MQVRIDGHLYVVGVSCSVIEVELTDSDKENISNMEKKAHHYFEFSKTAEKEVMSRVQEIEREG